MESEDYEYFSSPRAMSRAAGKSSLDLAPRANRMFGDSQQTSPASTLNRRSRPQASSVTGSLSSLYQARKANDSATVLQIKEQFQKQIEEMLKSTQRHETNRHHTQPTIKPELFKTNPEPFRSPTRNEPVRSPTRNEPARSPSKFEPSRTSYKHEPIRPPTRMEPSRPPPTRPEPIRSATRLSAGLQLDPPPEFGGGEPSAGGGARTAESPRRWGLADFSDLGKLDLGVGSPKPWSPAQYPQSDRQKPGAPIQYSKPEKQRLESQALNSQSDKPRLVKSATQQERNESRAEPKQPSSENVASKPIISIGARDTDNVNFRNIERGKSFLEARSAVQRQIEKMFVEADKKEDSSPARPPASNIKHTMHGVSHVRPDEEDLYQTPPPVHYGMDEAIKARRTSPKFMRERAESRRQEEETPPPRSRGLSPFNSDSDKSKVENFNSRSTIAERSLDRRDKFMSLDSLASASTSASTFVDLGNIDMNKRDRRASVDEESLAAQVRRRERSREAQENVRRISVHQDSFDYTTTDGAVTSSAPSPRGTMETRVSLPPKHTSSIQKSKPVKYKIEYLGAVPLRSKATNLDSLQVPLKELYFKHKALQSLGHSNLPGTLEISDTGLRVQYIRELHKGVQELFNSFPTIAVWAAVKFTHKAVILPSSERRQKFAFTPLISDPQNEERRRVFYDLDNEEINLAQSGPHPPVFACVMRRSGMPKQLECHGFVCASSEDAIIIAASLYQALVDTMKKHKAAGHARANQPSPRNQIQRSEFLRRSSRRSSKRGEPPVRPPRKKRTRGEEPRVITGLVRRRSIRSSTRSVRSNRSNKSNKSARRRNQRHVQIQREELTRKSSRRMKAAGGEMSGAANPSGDLLTKVSIGRTKSFVKTGNQYNLQELFRELKEKEGVDSIDDVLKRVISPNGMSFNDIKPVYRELLLKLAMTMSQDEIFERSKSIMASNKKVKKKSRDNENSGSLGSFFKSFSRPSSKSNSLASKRTVASLDTHKKLSEEAMKPSKPSKSSRGKPLTKADISGPLQVLGESTKPPKDALPPGDDQTDDAYVSCSECAYESVCNYDTCTSCRIKNAPPRPSAQDMKSLIGLKTIEVPQECDADSCISSEKCYCSLRGDPRVKPPPKPQISPSVYSEAAADSGTVTDSYSGTCYSGSVRSRVPTSSTSPLTTWKRNNMMMEKSGGPGTCTCSCSEYSDTGAPTNSLKFSRNLPPLPAEATVRRRKNSGGSYDSYSHHPHHHWHDGPRRNMTDGRGSEGSSSCSSSSNRSSVSPTNSSLRSSVSPTGSSSSNPKVLVVSAVDPRGNVVYRGSSSSNPTKATAAAAKAHHHAQSEQNILSLKKSAEIAALFSGSKISTTTDLVDESDSCSCSRASTRSSANIGSHMGYFP